MNLFLCGTRDMIVRKDAVQFASYENLHKLLDTFGVQRPGRAYYAKLGGDL
ncbi:MAG: hypothetical protein ABW352_11720 [Polyangiales bacterium]